MIILKRFALMVGMLLLALIGWIAFNSIDDDSFDDRGLLGGFVTPSAEHNGYTVVAYLNSEAPLFSQEDDIERLRQHVTGAIWDPVFVARVLAEGEHVLRDVRVANQRPHFRIEGFVRAEDIPHYQAFIGASRLLLLASMQHARLGEADQAIEAARAAVLFGHHVMHDENLVLLSYLIGMAMRNEALNWLHYYAFEPALSPRQLHALQAITAQLDDYADDGFDRVFKGELAFAVAMLEEAKSRDLGQRLREFRTALEMSQMMEGSEDAGLFARPGPAEFLGVFIPDYFLHDNKVISASARSLRRLADQASRSCHAVEFESAEHNTGGVVDWMRPNAVGKLWIEGGTENYKDYFWRRCLSHVYVDAVRTAIALQRYARRHGVMAENLDVLVPEYIDRLPVDYFTGDPLKYSAKNGWLYSVGADFSDDGGALDAIYAGRCHADEPCYTNPTVPIRPVRAEQTW